jgi:hypothetical protein
MYCSADISRLEELLALDQNQRDILDDQMLALLFIVLRLAACFEE